MKTQEEFEVRKKEKQIIDIVCSIPLKKWMCRDKSGSRFHARFKHERVTLCFAPQMNPFLVISGVEFYDNEKLSELVAKLTKSHKEQLLREKERTIDNIHSVFTN